MNDDYVYDEEFYEKKVQDLIKKSKKNRKRMKKATYDELPYLEKQSIKIAQQLEDLIAELEVEDFLMRGPMGEDPK